MPAHLAIALSTTSLGSDSYFAFWRAASNLGFIEGSAPNLAAMVMSFPTLA